MWKALEKCEGAFWLYYLRYFVIYAALLVIADMIFGKTIYWDTTIELAGIVAFLYALLARRRPKFNSN